MMVAGRASRNWLRVIGAAFAVCSMPVHAEELSAAHYTASDAVNGAQLRAELEVVIVTLYNPCIGGRRSDAAFARYDALRESQSGHKRMMDFVIARADYDYRMSLVDIACPVLNDDEKAQRNTLNAAVANSSMDRIDAVLTAMDRADTEKAD